METQPSYNKIGIQKPGGKLHEPSRELLTFCGLRYDEPKSKRLWAKAKYSGFEIYFLREADIPGLVARGKLDLGIVGQYSLIESGETVGASIDLNLGEWPLVLAVKKDSKISSPEELEGARVATSYPRITTDYFDGRMVRVETSYWSGSTEAAIKIGDADAVVDLVDTGKTMNANGLKPIDIVAIQGASLIVRPDLQPKSWHREDLNKFLGKAREYSKMNRESHSATDTTP